MEQEEKIYKPGDNIYDPDRDEYMIVICDNGDGTLTAAQVDIDIVIVEKCEIKKV